jgi:L-alanine-DL-glutamate epimerase-like enolase superfamily enzyme
MPFEIQQERKMKITSIKTYVCNAFRTNWVFVKVFTDEPGLWGTGEATLEYKEGAIVAADFIIGKSAGLYDMNSMVTAE